MIIFSLNNIFCIEIAYNLYGALMGRLLCSSCQYQSFISLVILTPKKLTALLSLIKKKG